MAGVIWTERATRDLEEACAYLDLESPGYSKKLARAIKEIAEDIGEQPHFGPEVPEFGRKHIRERLFEKYRIIYRVRGSVVEIIAVRHGARRLPRSL